MLYFNLCFGVFFVLLLLGRKLILAGVELFGTSDSSSDSEASPKTIPQTTRFEVSIWKLEVVEI